jgi:putative glycosyltransferase (TIGR04372 family)
MTWLDLLLGIILGVPMWVWSNYRPIQVQAIWGVRIGHLALDPELFLSRRASSGLPLSKVWFFVEGPVCNAALLKKWRQVLKVGPAWLLGPIYRASMRFHWLGLHPLDWSGVPSQFDFSCLDGTNPSWSFGDAERAKGSALLWELGVPEGRPYVCLAIRDGAYLRAVDTSRNWDYHMYRDSQIADYELMADKLVERGYAVIRMGRIMESAFGSANPEVIDYASSPLRSDFADLWLFANCAFCISTSTGMDALASIQRRPIGLVNIANSGSLSLGKGSKLVMFKELVDVHTGAVLDLLDDRTSEVMAFPNSPLVTEMGLAFRDNSPTDLESFADEMIDVIEGRLQLTVEQMAVEREFLARIPGPLDYTQADFHVSPSWLRSHSSVE